MELNIDKNKKALSEISDAFGMFSDSLDIISYLIDIGKKSHNMEEEDKVDKNSISGCTSKAWMIISKLSNGTYSIRTDSDSHLVSGLLYLLSLSVNYRDSKFINDFDVLSLLNDIGLNNNITSQRTNGLLSALEMVKERIN